MPRPHAHPTLAGRPEVKLAIDKRDAAAETAREAYRAWKDAEQRLEWAEAGLEVIVAATATLA